MIFICQPTLDWSYGYPTSGVAEKLSASLFQHPASRFICRKVLLNYSGVPPVADCLGIRVAAGVRVGSGAALPFDYNAFLKIH